MEQLKQTNLELEAKVLSLQSQLMEEVRVEGLAQRMKEKDERIQQLENTIIDHIESKTKLPLGDNIDKEDSFQSNQSVHSYKILVRSLRE